MCRRVHLLYELLGGEAEPFVAWPDTPSERMPVYADAGAALAHMLAKQDWQNARRYTFNHTAPFLLPVVKMHE